MQRRKAQYREPTHLFWRARESNIRSYLNLYKVSCVTIHHRIKPNIRFHYSWWVIGVQPRYSIYSSHFGRSVFSQWSCACTHSTHILAMYTYTLPILIPLLLWWDNHCLGTIVRPVGINCSWPTSAFGCPKGNHVLDTTLWHSNDHSLRHVHM